jgi:DNA-binding CsgD family transcriptional regulator
LPSANIAAKLFISELTVRNHLHAIYERVGVSGRRELLGRFVQGLIEGNA